MHLRNHVKCQTGTTSLSIDSSTNTQPYPIPVINPAIPNIELPRHPNPTKSSPMPFPLPCPILEQSLFGNPSRTHCRTRRAPPPRATTQQKILRRISQL